jgi:hypothetical protein
MKDIKTIPPHRPSSIRYPEPGTLLHKLLTELDGSNELWANRIKDDPEFSPAWPVIAEDLRASRTPVFKMSFHEYRYAVMRHELILERIEDLTCGAGHGSEYDAAYGRAIADIDHLFQDPSPTSVFLLDTLARDRMALAFERSSQHERDWTKPWERGAVDLIILTAWLDASLPRAFRGQGGQKSDRQLHKEVGARLGVTAGAVRYSRKRTTLQTDRSKLRAIARLSEVMAEYEGKPHSGVTFDMLRQFTEGARNSPSK